LNPFLRNQGKWVFLAGACFLVGGVFLSSPLLVLLGQVHIVLLMVSLVLLVPGVLALDRRFVSIDVLDAAESPGTGKVVGERERLALGFRNTSGVGLYHVRAKPFASAGLDIEPLSLRDPLRGGRALATEVAVEGKRAGRWVLHGFDLTVSDPLGLVDGRDYLPCTHAFEVYPLAGPILRRKSARRNQAISDLGVHVVDQVGSGSDLRELRDYQPGDPLRDIAWKTSLRARKLVSRDYENEITTNTYLVLDISSSMRGGQWAGQKLDFGLQLLVDRADAVIRRKDRVGIVTFDERVYGHVPLGHSSAHMKRILHHLVGLNAVVDPDLTELDETDVERLAADYLLVQERLDFRKGETDPESGVNGGLLRRWIETQPESKSLKSPVLTQGIVNGHASGLRRFLQLRGVDVPFRVEARLGMKERGIAHAIETIMSHAPKGTKVVVISDLCGILNPDMLSKVLRQAAANRFDIEFEVLFTPDFYQDSEMTQSYQVVRGLFTSAEAEERSKIVKKLRAMGVKVRVKGPSKGLALENRSV